MTFHDSEYDFLRMQGGMSDLSRLYKIEYRFLLKIVSQCKQQKNDRN